MTKKHCQQANIVRAVVRRTSNKEIDFVKLCPGPFFDKTTLFPILFLTGLDSYYEGVILMSFPIQLVKKIIKNYYA